MADINSILSFVKSSGGISGLFRSIVSGNKDLVGVDIGSHSVKIVWLEPKGKELNLRSWGHIPLNFKTEDSPEERKIQTAQTIRDFFLQNAIPLKNVATSVSGNAVIVRYVKLPKLSKQELKLTLGIEAEPFIPFDIKEVELGCHVLNEIMEEGQKKMETVLVAAKREIIQDRIEVLQAADLKLFVIDVDAFALETAYGRQSPEGGASADAGALLFLNMGHRVTNLSILENGVSRVVRDIFIAGSTLDKAIQKILTVDQSRTEELKKTKGILISAEEKEDAIQEDDREALAVSKAVSGMARDLVGEISRSVDFYLSQGQERSIGRIILTGGLANLKNLPQFLSSEFKVPVEVLNPLSFLEGKASDIPKEILPSLSVAAGLALRKVGDSEQ